MHNKKDKRFSSKKFVLGNSFFNEKFNIPIYQRLYVWETEQVNTLIEDLVKAFNHNSNDIYYLGGIVVVSNGDKYDLIDGQQRFTTLKILREILGDQDLKLYFSIRKDVWNEFADKDQSEHIDIKKMQDAKKLLEIGLEKLDEKRKINDEDIKQTFLQYLKDKVHLVVTSVPVNADLNKLFELINGRGEQLQQHEILKAKILARIPNNQTKYGKIWDICADMDNFLDINIKKSLVREDKNKKMIPFTWKDYFNLGDIWDIETVLEKIPSSQLDKTGLSISTIVTKDLKIIESEYKYLDPEDEPSGEYLSIISFSMFLLYALVSFEEVDYFDKMKKNSIEFKDKKLIEIFEQVLPFDKENDEIFSKFIDHLFSLRRLYDKWIIKNYKEVGDNTNETDHKISYIKKYENNNNVTRQIKSLEKSRDLALLQSMLYHSHTRNTQEWIIPFLREMQKNDSVDQALFSLKNIDNHLYSQFDTKDTILYRAVQFDSKNIIIDTKAICKYLLKKPKNYHDFSHYWFYKMDWVIWSLLKEDEKLKEFRFTARNSIEHISPQNPKDENIERDKVEKKNENSFGNLALISVAHNSSFSNNGFQTKMGYFNDKKIKNLKISLIKDNSRWGNDACRNHLVVCLTYIKKYYENHSEI